MVTLEWVALAAAVILLGVGILIFIKPSINTATNHVGSNIVSTVDADP